jgi:O-antigen/teichoic acid export membrane protein
MSLGPIASIITFQFDRLFIARAASLSALTLYAVPANLLQRLQILPNSISVVAVPVMAEISGETSHTERVYLKAQRFVLWIVLPMYAGLFALMPQFLGLWLGGDFGGRSVWPARLLVAAQAFAALNAIPNAAALGKDRPAWISATAWAQAVVSLLAWRLLIPRYGLLGVAAGSLLAQAGPNLLYVWGVHRLIGVTWGRFWSQALSRPAFCAGALLCLLLAVHGRVQSWPVFLAVVAGGCALYAASAWFVALPEDREALRWATRKFSAR